MGKYPITICLLIVSCYFIGAYSAFASPSDVPSRETFDKIDTQSLVHHNLHFTPCIAECLISIEQGKEEDQRLQSPNHFGPKYLPLSLGPLYAFIQPKSPLNNTVNISLYILDCALLI